MAENVREYQIDLKRFPKKEIGIEVVCTILSGNEAQGEWRSGPLLLKFIKP